MYNPHIRFADVHQQLPQAGWKPPETPEHVADALCGHEELNVLAVPDERHSHHQDLERHHGNRPLKKPCLVSPEGGQATVHNTSASVACSSRPCGWRSTGWPLGT